MDATTIANLALAKIGDLSIMALDDPTPEARFCNLFYAPTAQELFRVHNWNWATSIAQLSPLSPAPEFNWSYNYALPSDFGRLLSFNQATTYDPLVPYQIMGGALMTDESSAVLTYIRKIVDENLFDAMFVELFALKLGAKLARPLAGSLDIEKVLLAEFQRTLAEARRIDAGETSDRRKPIWVDSQLVASRYSGYL